MSAARLLLKQVMLNGQEIQVFDLLRYRHIWLDAERVALQTSKGWDVFEVVKWEEVSEIPILLVRHIGRLDSLPVGVVG